MHSCFSALSIRRQDSVVKCYRISFAILVPTDSELWGWCFTFPHCPFHGIESGSCVVGAEFTDGRMKWPVPKTKAKEPVSFQENGPFPFLFQLETVVWAWLPCRIFGLPQSLVPSLSSMGTPTSREIEPLWFFSPTADSAAFSIKCLCFSDKSLLLPSHSQLVADLFSDLDVSKGPRWLEIRCLFPACHAFCLTLLVTSP